MSLTSNETAISRGVVSRKLPPCERIQRPIDITSNPQEGRRSLPPFCIFPPLNFKGKRKIIKSGDCLSPETFKFKLDQALPL